MSTFNFKITYHLGSKKRNMILHQVYDGGFWSLWSDIKKLLFKDLGYPEKQIRLYWIDNADDEIEILCDRDIECLKNFPNSDSLYPHIHVENVAEETSKSNTTAEPTSTNSTSNQTKVPPADGSYEFAVHDRVECDACLMAPIVGFRYKCIQCSNYDLCQNCESKHVHSEHMMVRMPTNNCPSVVETYITGRSSGGRKYAKRSKNSCPFVKNGLSVILDDNNGENSNAGGVGDNVEMQSTPSNGKERHHGRRHHRRHQRNNFLAHLYEMMHDLAEGGGAAAAAHANGGFEEVCISTPASSGQHTTTTNNKDFEATEINPNIIMAAQIAAQKAHESAFKAAEIVTKVAHETAIIPTKTVTAEILAKHTNDANKKETTKDKIDATTSPRDSSNTVSDTPTPSVSDTPMPSLCDTSIPPLSDTPAPSLETFVQFLDPQYMRTGIQILNNFSDMFSKMLDPMDNNKEDLRKNSTTSNKSSSVSSNLNSINDGGDKNECEKEKSVEKQQNNKEFNKEGKEAESDDASCNVELEDIGSDSESDSVSESFIKLDAPKEANTTTKTTTANSSAGSTPPQSLNKSNVMNFAQLSANLKAHIAGETVKKNTAATSIETGVAATEQATKTSNTATAATTGEPIVVPINSATTTTTATNEERRAVPVYHAVEHINNSVHAMMAMGFSNEGAWLTQLLESVNGNIPDALDLMTVAQRGGGR